MARRRKNRVLRTLLIIIAGIAGVAGVFAAIYLTSLNRKLSLYEVCLSNNTGVLSLSTDSKKLAPNLDIISKPITVKITEDSSECFIRAKIVFENDSDDNRVLSFVSQLNYYTNSIKTFSNANYYWKYFAKDNSFYLMSEKTDNLRVVSKKDSDYKFVEKLTVPSAIGQVSSLNSDGENVQIGEDITIKVIFECVQSSLNLKSSAKIDNTREYFNNLSTFTEGYFTSCNGYITSYNGGEECLTLPKFVGEDYIIGVSEGAFSNSVLKTLVIPGSYIYFEDNAFLNLTNLTFVSLKNQTKMNLSSTTFSAKNSLEIYSTESLYNYVSKNYGTYNYFTNFKTYTEIAETDISKLNKNITYLYAPNITEFTGKFENFTKLKFVYAPNLTKINTQMFSGLTGLIDVDCPNATQVENNAFQGCSSLCNVSLSKKLDSIGESSFANCTKLKNVNFIKNLSVIPKQAFKNCAISSIELNAEGVEILSGAFRQNGSLNTVKILSLSKIEENAFGECDKLNSFTVLDVKDLSINQNAFVGASNVSVMSNVLFVFNSNDIKSSVTEQISGIKNLVLSVNNGVLTSCVGTIRDLDLTKYSKLFSITSIGKEAFKNNTTIKTLIIPSNIKTINDNFIVGATNLTQITINSYNPPKFSEKCFENVSNITIYVPTVNIDLYNTLLEDFDVNIVGK